MAFDVLYRYLRHLGYDVQYVRNFTDVDDKIIKRAAELDITPSELSQKWVTYTETRVSALALAIRCNLVHAAPICL